MYEKTFYTGGAQVIYLGDGSRTVFPVSFPADSAEELQPFIVSLGNSTSAIRALDQSEWGFNAATGNVTIVPGSTPAEGERFVIMRYTPIERRGSYSPGGPLTADSINADLTRITKICVDLDARLRRFGGSDGIIDVWAGIFDHLRVNSGATVYNSATVSGLLSATSAVVEEYLGCSGSIAAGSNLTVLNSATVGDYLGVTGSAAVGGNLTVNSSATVGGTLAASSVEVGNYLGVVSSAAVGGNLTVNSSAIVGGFLGVTGSAQIDGGLAASSVEVGNYLGVVSSAAVGGNLTVNGSAAVGGNLTVNSSATVGGHLTVAENATIGGKLTVSDGGIISSSVVEDYGYSIKTAELELMESGAIVRRTSTGIIPLSYGLAAGMISYTNSAAGLSGVITYNSATSQWSEGDNFDLSCSFDSATGAIAVRLVTNADGAGNDQFEFTASGTGSIVTAGQLTSTIEEAGSTTIVTGGGYTCTILTSGIGSAGQVYSSGEYNIFDELMNGGTVSGAMVEGQPFSTTLGPYTMTYTSNGGLTVAYDNYDEIAGASKYQSAVFNSGGVSLVGSNDQSMEHYSIGVGNGGITLEYGDDRPESQTFVVGLEDITANGSAITQSRTLFDGTSLGIAPLAGGINYNCAWPLSVLSLGSALPGCNVTILFKVASGAIIVPPHNVPRFGVSSYTPGSRYVMMVNGDMTVVAEAL